MTRSQRLMVIAVIIFILSLVYAWLETPRLEKAPPVLEKKVVRAENKSSAEVARLYAGRLRVDLLTHKTGKYSGIKRDLFTGKVAASAPPPPPPPEPEVVATPAPEPVADEVSAAPVAEVVRTQLAQFTFLGYLKKKFQKSVFLTAAGEIFIVKQGDRFGDQSRFEVQTITVDKMIISDHISGSFISVSLVEQAPLVPDEMPSATALPGASRYRSVAVSPSVSQPAVVPYPHPTVIKPAPDSASPVDAEEVPIDSEVPPHTNVPPMLINFPKGISHD
ncbi:MAG: hypothetical protein RQ724_06915 [Desulfuromonadales bacterium]|nr:hypothetical protein [Desulfuromonadales bacterium]